MLLDSSFLLFTADSRKKYRQNLVIFSSSEMSLPQLLVRPPAQSVAPTRKDSSTIFKERRKASLRRKRRDSKSKTKDRKESKKMSKEEDQSFDRDGVGNIRLEEQFKLEHLQQLMDLFDSFKPADDEPGDQTRSILKFISRNDNKPKREPGCMNLQEFKDTIAEVLATDEYNDQLDKLFAKLDTSCDGYVDWNEFCTYMLLLYRENDYMQTKKEIPFRSEARIRHIVYNRQETSTKVIAVDNPLRYVSISKEGVLSIWDPVHMVIEKHFDIAPVEDDPRGQKRRFKTWFTDLTFLPNCHKIAIASTSRDIRFYDVSTGQYFEEFHLFALPDVPYSMDYHFNERNPNGESVFVYGDDAGALNVLYFTRPVSQLFDTPFMEEKKVQKIFMKDLGHHSKWVRHVVAMEVMPDIIKKVKYIPDNENIMCCCTNPRSSLVVWDIMRKKKTYIFRMNKGCETFDYNKNLNILVTGSPDHMVRIWNPYVTSKPTAILQGHLTGVIDVIIHERFGQVFSYSRDAAVKVWDTKEHSCLQTVQLKFPTSVHSRLPEHGYFPCRLIPPPANCLLVAANDYLGQLKLGQVEEVKSALPATHVTQLCSAIYNPYFRQVVTGADDSTVAIWDVDSGGKTLVFSNAHGDEEITCMVFDNTWRRLITAARNGTVKVWNSQNGHNLHKLEPVGDVEVTGIIPLADRRVILTVGWSRKLSVYDDSDPDNMYIKADTSWKGGQVHKDDILAIDFCPPNLLATASYDGELVLWSTETEKMYMRLRKGQPYKMSRQMESLHVTLVSNSRPSSRPGSKNSRPNSRHRKSHKPAEGDPVPVDKLLFLPSRYKNAKRNDGAILISSEAGVLKWWSIFGQKHELGEFYAPDKEDESVLAIDADSDNTTIATGDTQGNISLWDIADYCTFPRDMKVTTKPPLISSWKAHDSALVSVQIIDHDCGQFVLSASTDKTARLWSIEGYYIGTFGQKKLWNLKRRRTWAHPKDPWSVLDRGKVIPEGANAVDTDTPANADRPDTDDDDTNEQKEEADESPSPDHLETDGTRLDLIEEELDEENDDLPELPSVHVLSDTDDQRQRLKSKSLDSGGTAETGDFVIAFHKNRSQTFAFSSDTTRHKTLLGIRAERDLLRQKFSRQERRHYGDINIKTMSRMNGKVCSPFQALATPDITVIPIPRGLPVTPRMVSRGYTSTNMDEDSLQKMDLRYYYHEGDERGKSDGRRSHRLPAIRGRKGQPSVATMSRGITM